MIIINAKTYPQATGNAAVVLAKECEAAKKQYGQDIRIAVQATDIDRVAKAVKIPVYAQHVDTAKPGKSTGAVTALALKSAGAKGCLINHSEHSLSDKEIRETVKALKAEGLETIVLCSTAAQIKKLSDTKPTMFVIEPPEFIASETSVSDARPQLIAKAVSASGKVPLLVGAGVKSIHDLAIAKERGSVGAILASHIMSRKRQKECVCGLAETIEKFAILQM